MTATTGRGDRFLALSRQPKWLLAALDGDRVLTELASTLPECRSGALALTSCEVRRLVLEGESGHWVGTYRIGSDRGPDGLRTIDLLGWVMPPHRARPRPSEAPSVAGFGEPGWSCWLPTLGLHLQTPASPMGTTTELADPAHALGVATEVLLAAPDLAPGFSVRACTAHLLGFKPGNRSVARYDLELADSSGGERSVNVVVKTYRSDKGRVAHDAMVSLWAALGGDGTVEVARPLAYLPDRKLLAQTVLAADQTLEDVAGAALRDGSRQGLAAAAVAIEAASRALAALHHSGVTANRTVVLPERIGQARKLVERITAALSPLSPCAALEPVLAHIDTVSSLQPPDAALPAHGAFAPEQVLVSGDVVGLVDFDDFCMAEPGMDVGMFLAALADLSLSAGPEDVLDSRRASFARLDLAAELGDVFLAEYARHGDVSPARASLWQTVELVVCAARTWSKVKRDGPTKDVRILEHHLARLGW